MNASKDRDLAPGAVRALLLYPVPNPSSDPSTQGAALSDLLFVYCELRCAARSRRIQESSQTHQLGQLVASLPDNVAIAHTELPLGRAMWVS